MRRHESSDRRSTESDEDVQQDAVHAESLELELARLRRENDELKAALERQTVLAEGLRARELAQRRTLEAGAIGIWDWDIERNHVTWSENIERIFRLSPGTFAGTYEAWMALVHPDDREPARQAVDAALQGAPYRAELRVLLPDGSAGFQLTRGYVERDAAGKPLFLRGMVFDITEQVVSRKRVTRLAEDLAARERFLRLITNAIPAMVGYVGTDGRYQFANQTYESWFGIRPERVIGQHMRELLGEQNFRFMEGFVDRAIAGESVQYAIEVTKPDGSIRHVQPSYIPDRDEKGRTRGFVVLALDVTEQVEGRKRAEQLAETARAANRAKDEFLAMLGHELRNPMAPITTAIELMKLSGTDNFCKERQIIERQVKHMARLLDDLLDVSRITRGTVSIDRELVDLSQCVATGIELASPLLDLHRHRLFVKLEPNLIVMGDETRLAQVFSNLITNAAKYTPAGGEIEIGSAFRNGSVSVWIRDTGVGIRPEMLPKVFELFMQERQTIDRSEGGLGLGLAIVHSLVSMHGGTVTAESDGLGLGSTFTVSFPLARDPTFDDRPTSETRVGPQQAVRKVLVVDDNADAADLLAEALVYLGHEVRTALDGAQALRILEEFSPDIALLDIGLPVMDGYELARRIRANTRERPLFLIAVTGYGEERAREATREAGFDRHLTKPVDLPALLTAIDAAPKADSTAK
ncbi:MAG: PAS domain-containing protein [Myxococcales bacterium]